MKSMTSQRDTLLAGLESAAAYPHPVAAIECIETHISWVFLTGEYAYKLKKPVNLGFLDFSTLARRLHYCQEELRLNRRLAPDIYLQVVAVCRVAQGYRIYPLTQTTGEIVEYAVQMRQFDPHDGLDLLLQQDQLPAEVIDRLALQLARFHQQAPAAPAGSDYGSPEAVRQPALENFVQLRQHISHPAILARLEPLHDWTLQQADLLQNTFRLRQLAGQVRECHGDLHLRNIAWWRQQLIIFDCLEFNPGLRWIDTLSELAFLLMDFAARGHAELGWRLLNLYLEHSGDYDGLPVLRFYLVYRALVRVKVAAIALSQQRTPQQEAELVHYLAQAERFVRPHVPGLILAHGFSGCGKTWLSSRFMAHPWVIRLRSDIERLRHFSDVAHQPGAAGVGTGRYSAEMTAATYTHLQHRARKLLQAQFTVIIDATFLQQGQRRLMYELAAACHAPLLLVSLEADTATLQQRIRARQQTGRDASEADLAVLAYQLQHHDPLSAQERTHSLCLDTTRPMDQEAIWAEIQARLSTAPADPRRKSLQMS